MAAGTGRVEELIRAVRAGSIEKVRKLLDTKCNGEVINQLSGGKFDEGQFPLMVAFQLKDDVKRNEMVNLLLQKGANVNLQNRRGWSVLMKAVHNERMDIAGHLLELQGHKVDLELRNGTTANALMIACKQGNLKLVELLLKNGAKVNVPMQEDSSFGCPSSSDYYDVYLKKSPLIIAAENGHMEIAKLLSKKGANVVFGDNDCLSIACNKNNFDLVKCLLDNPSVNVNYKSMYRKETPLMRACYSSNVEIVSALLNKKADISLVNSSGESALIYAAKSNSLSVEIVQLLVTKCTLAEINLQTSSEGKTAVMVAIENGVYRNFKGVVAVLKVLLKKGADVNLQCEEGFTALMLALMERNQRYEDVNYDVVELLLQYSAEINYKKDWRGGSYPLHIQFPNQVAKLLLKNKVRICYRSLRGETPLLMYATSGNMEMVKFCVEEMKADINEMDDVGFYPLWRAVENKSYELVEYFLEKKALTDVCPDNKQSAETILLENSSSILEEIRHDTITSFLNLKRFLNASEEDDNMDVAEDKEDSNFSIAESPKSKKLKIGDDKLPTDDDKSESDEEIETSSLSADPRSQLIQENIPNVPDDNQLMDDTVKAVESSISINQRHANVIIIGPDGSGKSSLMYRLIGTQKLVATSTNIFEAITVEIPNWKEVESSLAFLHNMGIKPENVIFNDSPTTNDATLSSDNSHLTHESDVADAVTKYFDKQHSLNVFSVSGRVEFQRMISLIGPSIFLFVFRADMDLKAKFPVYNRKSDSKPINYYTSSLTVEETLLDCLACIRTLQAGVIHQKPYVFMVATHKDKIRDSDAKKLNEELYALIKGSGFSDLVCYAKGNELMFLVDNASNNDSDFQPIRGKVQSFVNARKLFNMEYPVKYLMFCAELQSDIREVLTLDECRVMAAKYNILDDGVFQLLDFLHYRTGLVQFININGVQPTILKRPGFLFNQMNNFVTTCALEKKKCILSSSALENVVGREDVFTPEEFAKILAHFNIIVPLASPECDSRYFNPSALLYLPENESVLKSKIMPLAICFKYKYCPRDLFNVLLTHLLGDSSMFQLNEEKTFKNELFFVVCSSNVHDEISLKYCFSHIEVKFFPEVLSKPRDNSIEKICTSIRWKIEEGIQKSIYKKVEYRLCLTCTLCSELHPVWGKITGHPLCETITGYKMKCMKNSLQVPEEGMYWFDEGFDDFNEIENSLHNREKINRKHAHCVLIGHTGAGKTSFMDRMLGKRRSAYNSTGVLEKVVTVDVDSDNPSTFHPVIVESGSNEWNYDVGQDQSAVLQLQQHSEARKLLKSEPVAPESAEDASLAPTPRESSASVNLASVPIETSKIAPASVSVSNMIPVNQHSTDFNDSLPAKSMQNSDPVNLIDNSDSYFEARRKIILESLKKHRGLKRYKNSYSLYFRDAGGQVEFQETVSLLLFGPSIFFFVFRADLDFKSLFTVKYRMSNNETSNCYTSSMTTEEALLQSLASIYALDTPAKSGVKTHKTRVFIVATHKDKLGLGAKNRLAELNEHLDSLIENCPFRSLVKYANKDKREVMFAVDNSSESEDDFIAIRSKINSLITKKEEFSVEYLVSYLLFCLDLQSDQRSILDLKDCESMAARYGIKEKEELYHLLNFLHLRLGVIQFINISGSEPVILKEPQLLFNAITSIIVGSFYSRALTRQQRNDITKKGILTLEELVKLLPKNDKISQDTYLNILKYLHIITPFSTSANKNKYFIPCILNHIPKSMEQPKTSVLPLAIKFKCEYCPRGIFGVLVTYLLNPAVKDDTSIVFILMENKIFKDQVYFKVDFLGDQDELSLTLHLTNIELHFFPKVSENRCQSVSYVCSKVRVAIVEAIYCSLQNLHYNEDRVKPEVFIRCDQCKDLHQVEDDRYIFCDQSRQTRSIPSQAKYWFIEKALPDLKGVEILKRTSVQVSQSPQTFHWKEYGLKLVIPQESLPSGTNSCTITISISISGQYLFPDGAELVSPVFWLRCEPQCHFQCPLSLEIEHCAFGENTHLLSMAKASCTQKNLPYRFNMCSGNFSKHSSYGSIMLNSFSGVGVVQQNSSQRQYWFSVFYTGSHDYWDIHFVITWCDQAHVTAAKDQYKSTSKRPCNFGSLLEFEEDTISLSIEDTNEESGWKVFPKLFPCEITKKAVDSYHSTQSIVIPHCVIKAVWTKKTPMEPLVQRVKILGTTQRNKFVSINIPGMSAKPHIASDTEPELAVSQCDWDKTGDFIEEKHIVVSTSSDSNKKRSNDTIGENEERIKRPRTNSTAEHCIEDLNSSSMELDCKNKEMNMQESKIINDNKDNSVAKKEYTRCDEEADFLECVKSFANIKGRHAISIITSHSLSAEDQLSLTVNFHTLFGFDMMTPATMDEKLRDNVEVEQILTAALNKHGCFSKSEKKFFLSLNDFNGHVEFPEMTSFLCIQPSVYLFSFRFDKYQGSLITKFSEGKMLLQLLTNIYSMPGKAQVLIVATHADEDDEVKMRLNNCVNHLLKKGPFRKLICYASEDPCIFKFGDFSDEDNIVQFIQSKVPESEEFTTSYSVNQFLCCLDLLSNNDNILTFDQFRPIAARYNVLEEEFHSLHRYCKDTQLVKLNDEEYVINKIKFSQLVESVFKKFKEAVVTCGQMEMAIKNVITDIEVIKSLLKILKHYHLAMSYDQDEKFFIPSNLSILPDSDEQDLENSDIKPLSVQFRVKDYIMYCPQGILGLLVSHLLNPPLAENGCVSLFLMEEAIFKDQVSFEVHSPAFEKPAKAELLIKIHSKYLEVNLYPIEVECKESLYSICGEIRSKIKNCLVQSFNDLNYKKGVMNPVICIKCQYRECSKLHKVTEINTGFKVHCPDNGTMINPTNGNYWYKEVLPDYSALRPIAEESVEVTTSQSKFDFEWKEYGLKLNIPRPHNVETCTITIIVSFGKNTMPKEKQLVSPVFWLKCEPSSYFDPPLYLEIKHCGEENTCLSMATAVCELPCIFKISDSGEFYENGYGAVRLKTLGGLHTGICVVQSELEKRRYWYSLFCSGPPLKRDFYFTVTWDDTAHITHISNYFREKKKAKICNPEQSLTFKENRLSLTIPKEGLPIDGWKVVSSNTSVSKKYIDSFEYSRLPVLMVRRSMTNCSTMPLHTVGISGTLETDNYLILDIPAESEENGGTVIVQENSCHARPTSLTSQASLLKSEDVAKVTPYLKQLNIRELIDVGSRLGLFYHELQNIRNECLLNDMVLRWLRRDNQVIITSGEPSWNSLCKALDACNHTGIASDIRRDEVGQKTL